MIELISVTNNNVKHFAAVGITAAELPVKDLGTGSTCMMLDTGKKYIYFEGTPTTFIIDQGKVSHVFNGATSKETLQAFIDLYYVR